MAGHSKWSNIKFRKMGQDAKRGKLFTRHIREINVAARQGGPDLPNNPRLRLAVDKALSANMTRDTIERAIKRGAGGQDNQDVEEIRYEGYGPGGVAILIDCMTNNRNRTVSEVRHVLVKSGGNLGTNGSVSYLFAQKGQILFAAGVDEDKVVEVALEVGADDVKTETDGSVEVVTNFEDFIRVKEAIESHELKFETAETSWIPETVVAITDKEQAEKFIKVIDRLEELDDVQAVYSNADIAMDVLTELN